METPLEIEGVDFFPLQNAKEHHTDKFEIVHGDPPTPVLRRGQDIELQLNFKDRDYDKSTDIIRLVFTFGSNPSPMSGTQGAASVTGRTEYSKDEAAWDVRLISAEEKSVKLQVRSPPGAPVGEWNFQVQSRLLSQRRAKPSVYDHPNMIYLLFNPWCKDDQVYMEDGRLLDEYVLNDVGKIWVGPYGTCRGREWVFGQFDDAVLPATMLMLERAIKTLPAKRGDPVAITRAISRIVNSNDEDHEVSGVLTGRWDGEYDDGTAPHAWTGSVGILEEYLATKEEVRYGQCWVFAGVVTTVCRALGIPSRVVSNLVSAHDANTSLSIDRYYDLNDEELGWDPHSDGNSDSIWNYHVWNDVWMARPDLPKGYGGWQAIDATPQETSAGFFQCGPAPLEAIRCGAVGFNYDVPFLLASVNADLIRWREDPDNDLGYSPISCNKYHIGRFIYTKQPWIFDPNGDKDREDITDQYKPPEGSNTERMALLNAVKDIDRARLFYRVPSKDTENIVFDLLDIETIDIGKDFSVTVNIDNKSNSEKTVNAVLSAASVYYTGIKAHLIKKASGKFTVNPHSKEQLKLNISADEYLDKLVEYNNMKIYAIATVEETNEAWGDEDDFQVIVPKLNIKLQSDEIQVQLPTTVTFSFTNPLKKTLTNCKFIYEGPGIVKRKTIDYRDIEAGEEVTVEHRFTPQKPGSRKIIGTFNSKELVDITGSATVEVYDESEE